MEWISVKDRLPENGEVVLIQLKYAQPFLCVSRYLDNFITSDDEYRKVFITMIIHPKFPKHWLFTEEYKKISRIPKNKVYSWISIPDLKNNFN